MSTRPYLPPQPVITAASMGASITSSPTLFNNVSKIGYQAIWSSGSTPIGTLAVQFSSDYAIGPTGQVVNSGTWTTATINYLGAPVTSIPVTGNSGSAFIDIYETSAHASRLVYTRTSGTATMTAYVNGKVG